MDTLTGVVENITFQGQNEYVVFRLKTEQGFVVVAGNVGAPLPGEDVEVSGSWTVHPRYGRQFRGEALRRVTPATLPAASKIGAATYITVLASSSGSSRVERAPYCPRRVR